MSDWAAPLRLETKTALLASANVAAAVAERVIAEQAEPQYSEAAQAPEKLPRICVYVGEDRPVSSSNGTRWDTTTTLVIDVWHYGTATPLKTAEEAAGDNRDALAFDVLAATVGNPEWRALFSENPECTISRKVEKKGDITYGAARIMLSVEQPIDWSTPEVATPFERFVGTFPDTLGGGPEDQDELVVDVTIQQTGDDA